MALHLRTKMDGNGNKVLVIKFNDERAFSVQTLDNLPQTHRLFNRAIALVEAVSYILIHGTERQKDVITRAIRYECRGLEMFYKGCDNYNILREAFPEYFDNENE